MPKTTGPSAEHVELTATIMPEDAAQDAACTVNLAEIDAVDHASPVALLTPLRVQRLGYDPVHLRLFTGDAHPALIHWPRVEGRPLPFLCNDPAWQAREQRRPRCAFCRAGVSREERLLLPACEVVDDEVVLLAIPRSGSPGSLLQALRPHFKPEFDTQLLEIRKRPTGRYEAIRLAGRDLDLSDEAIKTFLARTVDLSPQELGDYFRQAYRQVANQELLRDLPELAKRIRNREPELDLSEL